MAIEGGHRVFKSHTKLPDDKTWFGELFPVFVLREVLVAKAATFVTDVPGAVSILDNLRSRRSRQCGLVKCIGNDFA
jgi:hypothetical protein